MRFSFASSVIVRDAQGRYLLVVNKHALEARGEILLLPVGGKVSVDPLCLLPFQEHGAVFASPIPPDPKHASALALFGYKVDPPMVDLVFHGSREHASTYRRLFMADKAAQAYAAKREAREELADETRVLRDTHLRKYFWEDLPYSHMGEEVAHSARAGGDETLRLMSFFDMEFEPRILRRIERRATRRPLHQRMVAWLRGAYTGPLIYFATSEEIRKGVTSGDGVKIASICKTMLH